MVKWSVFLLLCAVTTSGWSHGLDLNLNDERVRLIGQFHQNRTETELGILVDEDDSTTLHAGFHLVDRTGDKTPDISMALGGRLYGSKIDIVGNNDIEAVAIAIGGAIIYTPAQLYKRANFVFNIHYAPSILSFNDADNYIEYGARAEYQVLTNGFIYAGYRVLEIGLTGSNVDLELDDDLHFGLRLSF